MKIISYALIFTSLSFLPFLSYYQTKQQPIQTSSSLLCYSVTNQQTSNISTHICSDFNQQEQNPRLKQETNPKHVRTKIIRINQEKHAQIHPNWIDLIKTETIIHRFKKRQIYKLMILAHRSERRRSASTEFRCRRRGLRREMDKGKAVFRVKR